MHFLKGGLHVMGTRQMNAIIVNKMLKQCENQRVNLSHIPIIRPYHTMPITSPDCLNVITSLQLLERLIVGIASSFTQQGVASGVVSGVAICVAITVWILV